LKDRRARPSDAELNEVLRRGRLEDLAGITSIASLLFGAALAVVLQLGGPVNIILPFIALAGLIAMLATVAWLVGNMRTTKALDRLDPEGRQASPLWAYLLPIGLATVALGIMYSSVGADFKRWLWIAYFVGAAFLFVWAQTRRPSARSRRRR